MKNVKLVSDSVALDLIMEVSKNHKWDKEKMYYLWILGIPSFL